MRMSVTGKTTSIEEMIATTKRGLLVTRFDQVKASWEYGTEMAYRGYTRDGLWLIENGKISKPAINMMFRDTVLRALNNVEQAGVPQRAFHPQNYTKAWWWIPQPVIAPALKIRDFDFVALSDAI